MPDVVVVGGGAAGCVVATRLAQAGRSVVLLEAGPDRRTDLPGELRDGWTIQRDLLDWGYMAEADETHPPRHVWRKKLLGGTGWLTRFTPRGSRADYDSWGVQGWRFEDVLPYFVRLENDLDFGKEPWHGEGGPLPSVRHLERPYSSATQGLIEKLVAHGHPWAEDHNHPDAIGVGRMPMNTRDGCRVTTADAYLPLADPANLTIRSGALVDRVIFEGTTAAGVLLADGTAIEAGGVVLCAGVYGSPPVLLRSDIGPNGRLVQLRGVGQNLADHPTVSIALPYDGAAAQPVLHAITTFRSSETPVDQAPDLLFWIADPSGDPPEFEIEVLLMRPRSRGSVRLRSADPNDPPVIQLPNLAEPIDVSRLGEGYREALRVAGQPQPNDEELLDTIRRTVYSIPHVVGTCALGAVVDPGGHVRGTERLWVADASIIPEPPSGFVHFPTVMIAERLSESIAREA